MRAASVAWLVALALPLSAAEAQNPVAAGTAGRVAGQPVAARSIPRGAEIMLEDVVAESDSATARLGWIARRVIRKGEVLKEPAVVPPPMIRAGQVVQYRVARNGIAITVNGTAMADASLGESVLVRLDAKRRVQAVVSAPGLVTARTGRR